MSCDNPFDSNKLIYHAKYCGQMIQERKIPPPILVTLDPVNRCNRSCVWCNSGRQMSESCDEYSDYVIDGIASFLADWGVKAVCIAGGGEPTLLPRISDLIGDLRAHDIEPAIITNGSLLYRIRDIAGMLKFVGVSVDAGSDEVYCDLKGCSSGMFADVIGNMRSVRARWPDLEITWKYLIHPQNISDIVVAAEKARDAGCSGIHYRPYGRAWWDEDTTIFDRYKIDQAERAMQVAKEIFDEYDFRVSICTEKFSSAWDVYHPFEACWAVGMTCVIQPDGTVSLCCDRRGDPRVRLCHYDSLDDIRDAWGGNRHWKIMEEIRLSDCPRCTYTPHNQLMEAFEVCDRTNKNFI